MNHMVSFLCWLFGVLQIIGMAGGVCFWAVALWMLYTKRGRNIWAAICEMPEYRCDSCIDAECCVAAGTGALYPCWWYKEKDKP